MARSRKWADDRERRQAQSDTRRAARQAHQVEFIGIDGEGVGKWRDHRYVLLGVGSESISNENGLTFTSVMDFLYTRFQAGPTASFVGFFLGYDFTQWFKTLPESRARMLLTDSGRAKRARRKNPHLGPFPVTYEGWEFDILGMKRFKLRREGDKGWMYICDAGPFFQASLMSVIDPRKWEVPVVTPDEYAMLEEGKKRRDHAVLDDNMRAYTALENAVLARLMGRVNDGLTAAGIRLKRNQWFGPGQAAQAWLGQVQAPPGDVAYSAIARNRASRDVEGVTDVADAARASYYGGWFEIMAHGHIPEDTWEYDINSAYPHVISTLPCLLHGRWTHAHAAPEREPGSGALVLVHARVRGSDKRVGAMLHRCDDGSIRRPSETAGWYWQHELDAAQRAGVIDRVLYDETWTYDPCDCRPPMRGIAGLYEERLRIGKNSPAGKGYKLVYNSVYGKFAQSVGDPKYGNAFYASLVTSGCRAMILDAIATHPEGTNAVVMVATDGVYFTSPHRNLEICEKLGAWEETTHRNLTLFKPGVYWDDNARERIAKGDDPSFKARGISARQFGGQLAAIDAHFAGWPGRYPAERDPAGPRDGWYPKVTFTSGFSMITAVQALQRGKWFLAGAVGQQELTQDADPIGKRHSGYYEDGVYWSRPFKDGGPGGIESVPYERRFGQPDPDEYGINEDGTVKDQWAAMLR